MKRTGLLAIIIAPIYLFFPQILQILKSISGGLELFFVIAFFVFLKMMEPSGTHRTKDSHGNNSWDNQSESLFDCNSYSSGYSSDYENQKREELDRQRDFGHGGP